MVSAPNVSGFDHLVLRCADVQTTLTWYQDVLGLEGDRVDEWQAGTAPFPSVRVSDDTIIDLVGAATATIRTDAPGASPVGHLDHLCLVADKATVEAIAAEPERYGVVDGPAPRSGARGVGISVYLTDPDGTTVEIRHYEH